MSITIDPDLQRLIPPLSAEETAQLEANLVADGCRDPLVVWNETLIDGHNRLEICTRLNIPYRTVSMQFESKAHARVWMRNNQRGRRNLTKAWEIELELGNKEDLAAIAKKTQGKRTDLLSQNDKKLDAEAPKHNTQAEIAKAAGTSTGMVGMAEQVKKKAPEVWEKAKAGEVTVSAAYKQVKLEEKKEQRRRANDEIANRNIDSVSKKYGTVVIDPPWPMQKIIRDVRPNQVGFDYPVMTEEEIKAVQIPAADDCHLFVWTTHKFLPMALRCIEAWGFRYVCTMVWHKPGGFQPIGLPQYNCEFCIYCRIGSPQFVDTKAFLTCFQAPRGAHSEKPQEFYNVIARVTDGPRIDMFNRRQIDGFDTWGKESA